MAQAAPGTLTPLTTFCPLAAKLLEQGVAEPLRVDKLPGPLRAAAVPMRQPAHRKSYSDTHAALRRAAERLALVGRTHPEPIALHKFTIAGELRIEPGSDGIILAVRGRL
jgi:hypothetical protein